MDSARGSYKAYLNPDKNVTPNEAVAKRLRKHCNPNSLDNAHWLQHIRDPDQNAVQLLAVPRHDEVHMELGHQDDAREEPTQASEQDNRSFSPSPPPSPQQEHQPPEADDFDVEGSNHSASDGSDSDVDENIHATTFPYEKLRNFFEQPQIFRTLSIEISSAEILAMVLTIALVHNLTLSATCDILKMLNIILCSTVFPSTRFLFKSLLNPNFGMTLHYVCENCGNYLGKKGDPNIAECTNDLCEHFNNLAGYRYHNTFITLDVRNQLKELLEDPNTKFSFTSSDVVVLNEDLNGGVMYKNAVPKSDENSAQYITATFNSDSSPISKDSKTCITPVFLMINEILVQERAKNMILVGLWFGPEKPKMDVFMRPCIEILNDLRNNGIRVNRFGVEKIYKLISLCCCVDTVARAPMQGIVGVNGQQCCSWCYVQGELDETNTMKYPVRDPLPDCRTENSFADDYREFERQGQRVNGVQAVSQLILLRSFSMVWGFVPDYMHCCLLGVTRRFTNCWLTNHNAPYYIGTPTLTKFMDSILTKIAPPSYIKRMAKKLSELKLMKARELENWMLFYSVPVLQSVMDARYVRHWKLFVTSMYLLLQDTISEEDINTAELLLLEFAGKTLDLYGLHELTYNMHQLLHLAESVRRYGPLWSHTAFPFEAALGHWKRILKDTRGVPHQIVRNIEINRSRNIIFKHAFLSERVLKFCETVENKETEKAVRAEEGTIFKLGNRYNGPSYNLPPEQQYYEMDRFVRSGVTYTKFKGARTYDNSYICLHNGKFGQILHLLRCENDNTCYLIVKKLRFYEEVGVPQIKRIYNHGRNFSCKISDVKCVAVHIRVNENEFIAPIPSKHFLLNL